MGTNTQDQENHYQLGPLPRTVGQHAREALEVIGDLISIPFHLHSESRTFFATEEHPDKAKTVEDRQEIRQVLGRLRQRAIRTVYRATHRK